MTSEQFKEAQRLERAIQQLDSLLEPFLQQEKNDQEPTSGGGVAKPLLKFTVEAHYTNKGWVGRSFKNDREYPEITRELENCMKNISLILKQEKIKLQRQFDLL